MKNLFKFLFLSLIVISNIAPATAAPVKAQPTKPAIVEEVQNDISNEVIDYDKISAQLLVIEKEIQDEEFTRQSLDEASVYLTQEEIILDKAIRDIEKNSQYTQDKLTALGEAPTEGEEDEAIAAEREKYTAAMSSYKDRIIKANLLKIEITRVGAVVSEARSRILIGNLVAEQNMLISPSTFFKAISDSAIFLWDVTISPVKWYKELNDTELEAVHHHAWYVFLVIGFALSIGLFLRRYIINKWGYRRTEEQPRYGQKVSVACITALAYGVIPSLLIGGCLLWQITNENLTNSNFGVVLSNVLYYSLYITLTRALARVILAPWNGRWRLFSITDERAERLYSAITLSIILIGTIACIKHIAIYYNASDALMLLLEVTSDAIKAFVIILLTSRIFSESKKKQTAEVENATQAEDETDTESENVSSSLKIVAFTTLFAIATFGISLFGYPELATFIFNRFFISILMLGVFWIIKKVISDLLRRSIVFWIKTFKMRKRLLSKADFLMSLLITPILVMFLIYSLLTLWGVPGNFMLHGLAKLIFGFKVGGIQISLLSIAMGLIVFLVSITVVRILKARLANNLLSRINMDEGIKHSLVSGLGFVGFIISVILAIVAMGVDLSNLAVIAGALSVGIGFGLQDVIKNLVSGIIILFERPFKVGDWVILGGEEGKIKQINIRSTELETWTRRSVIIPNATLISTSLVNLTHENNCQRQTIKVGVSYDSDVEKVTQLLLECAKSNKKIMKNPAPYVLFQDFGASSLDFELRFYIADIWNGWTTSSDLRYEITRRFREENINIAFPQVVVHRGGDDPSFTG